MKKAVTLSIIIFALLFTQAYAQRAGSRHQIIEETNVAALKRLGKQASKKFKQEKAKALKLAEENGWQKKHVLPDGRIMELIAVKHGKPQYYVTHNINAAYTTAANEVWEGGALGLSLSGKDVTAGVWDGGGVLTSHQEFGGRVEQQDNPSGDADHATHVAGTIGAKGEEADAKGMAPEVTIDAYDWNDDTDELASAAADGLLVSNHSYGIGIGYTWTGVSWQWYGDPSISEEEDYRFGFYSQDAANWDELALDAPYLLVFVSAGNDRGSGPANGDYPVDGGADGFDCLGGKAIGKNVMAIGSILDLSDGYAEASEVEASSFSSWGPSDDGRIKPDIVGNGQDLYSTSSQGDDNYMSMSGTSMSSPNTTGSAALLQEHYHNRFEEYMRAATLKSLIIHTANEAGPNPGPDYMFGWGVMNTAGAAEVISDNLQNAFIREESLEDGQTYTFDVFATGDEPLKATINWADQPGDPVDPQLDPREPMLVNDLDLRIKQSSQEWKPWKLDPEKPDAAATKGDNTVDNVEKIELQNPEPGVYTVEVTHKGSLEAAPQNFSMIISGVSANSPGLFKARALSSTAIDISWLPNTDEDNVVMAYHTNPDFGKPVSGETYTAGDQIPGGGTVLYAGNDSSYLHQNLNSATTYYYSAWSVDADMQYSPAVETSATTLYDQVFMDGFEGDKDWTLKGEFERAKPEGRGGSADNSYPDPLAAAGGANVLGTDLSGLGLIPGDYEYGLKKNEYQAITPVMDCSNYTDMRLRFKRWLNIEDPKDIDRATIDVSVDSGQTWQTVWQNEQEIADKKWTEQVVDVSTMVDGQDSVMFRFTLGPTGYGQHFSGWNIDDFHAEGVVDKYPVTFEVTDGTDPLENAAVAFHENQKMTGAQGKVTFYNVEVGEKWSYVVRKNSFANDSGYVKLTDAELTENVTLSTGTPLYNVEFVVDNGITFQNNVSVSFNGETQTTDDYGKTVFEGVEKGANLVYTMTQNSHTHKDSLDVTDRSVQEQVTLTYNVHFLMEKDGNPISDASVELYGYGTKITDSQGKLTFKDVHADEDIPYLVGASGYKDASGRITVSNDDVQVKPTLMVSNLVTFNVTDGTSPINGAFVVIGSDTTHAETGGTVLVNLLNGEYTYEVAAKGYKSVKSTITLNDDDVDQSVSLEAVNYTASFNVSNGFAGVQEATVTIGGETLTTDAAGHASTEVTRGEYNLKVDKPGFETYTGSLEVVNFDITRNIDLSSSTYDVSVSVTGNGTALQGATVQVDTHNVVTPADGTVTLPLASGEYTLQVTADEYTAMEKDFTVETSARTVNAALDALFDVIFEVVQSDESGVENAVISIVDNKYVTDATGAATAELTAGSYNYSVARDGFKLTENALDLQADTTLLIGLTATAIQHANSDKLAVYPNPVDKQVTIALPGKQDYNLQITNLSGKVMLQEQNASGNYRLNMESWPEGVYILRMQLPDKLMMRKLIKQ